MNDPSPSPKIQGDYVGSSEVAAKQTATVAPLILWRAFSCGPRFSWCLSKSCFVVEIKIYLSNVELLNHDFLRNLIAFQGFIETCQKQQKLSKIQWLHEIILYLMYPRSCLRRPMLPWRRRSFQRTSATILESRATSTFIVRLSKPCSLVLELSNVGMEERISKKNYICISLRINFFSIFSVHLRLFFSRAIL